MSDKHIRDGCSAVGNKKNGGKYPGSVLLGDIAKYGSHAACKGDSPRDTRSHSRQQKKDTELNFSEAMMPAMHRVKATIPIRCAPTGFMRPASDPPIRYGVIMQAKTAAATKVLSVCNWSKKKKVTLIKPNGVN